VRGRQAADQHEQQVRRLCDVHVRAKLAALLRAPHQLAEEVWKGLRDLLLQPAELAVVAISAAALPAKRMMPGHSRASPITRSSPRQS